MAAQPLLEQVHGAAVGEALDHFVFELRIEKQLRSQGELQQLQAAVGTLDPALKDRDAGGPLFRFPALTRRRLPRGLGHGPSIRSLPISSKIACFGDEGKRGSPTTATPEAQAG